MSLEVSPLLAHDTTHTIAAAKELFARSGRSNLFVKIPGTPEGLPAIEDAIFCGVPVNVTLLFSREQYLAAAEAWLRGIERRIAAGLNPLVDSVASVFISRWDTAVAGRIPDALNNRLGIAVAGAIYKSYVDLLASPRWGRVFNSGARPQRLLWASTGTKDPKASDTLYIKALTAPFTVNTMPEATLNAFAEHGKAGPIMAADGVAAEKVLTQFGQAGVDVSTLAARLQDDGEKAFVKSWNELLAVIESKSGALKASRVTKCIARRTYWLLMLVEPTCRPWPPDRMRSGYLFAVERSRLSGWSQKSGSSSRIGDTMSSPSVIPDWSFTIGRCPILGILEKVGWDLTSQRHSSVRIKSSTTRRCRHWGVIAAVKCHF